MKEDLIFCPSFLLLPFVLGSGPWRRGTLQTEASDWPPAPPCRSASLAEAPEHPGISHNATGPPAAGRSARPPEDKVRRWTYKSISVEKNKCERVTHEHEHRQTSEQLVPACWVSSIAGWWSPGRAPVPGCRCVWRRSGSDPDPLRWRAVASAECCPPALSPRPGRRNTSRVIVNWFIYEWMNEWTEVKGRKTEREGLCLMSLLKSEDI